MRQNAISSFRASATIIVVLRAPLRLSSRPVPLRQPAVLLEPQEPPGELDQAAAHPGIASLGQPLFPPLRAALVGRAGQAGIARHRPAISQVAAQHLLDQHVGRLDSDADDAGQERAP